MRGLETTITQKGQVTIPAEIRSRLGLRPRDKVRFEIDGDAARLTAAPSRIARHFGAVTTPRAAGEARSEREAFERGVAKEAAGEDR